MGRLPPRLGRLAFWLAWPGLWLTLHGTKRTRVLITSGDHVLLVKSWLGDGKWLLPGGGLHRHEDPVAGAVREINEETGLIIQPEQLVFCSDTKISTQGFQYRCLLYRVELPIRLALKQSGVEIATAEWVSRDTLAASTAISAELARALSAWQ